MSRHLFNSVLKLLASLISYSSDFRKRFLFWGPLITPPFIKWSSELCFKVGNSSFKSAFSNPFFISVWFLPCLSLFSVVKILPRPLTVAFSCCDLLLVRIIPLEMGWAVLQTAVLLMSCLIGKKINQVNCFCITNSHLHSSSFSASWGIPQEAFTRVEKAETRSRLVL